MRRRRALVLLYAIGAAIGLPAAAAHANPDPGFVFGDVGKPVFEHLHADLLDPHFGARLYLASAVPGTLHKVVDPAGPDANARAALPNGDHVFLDVALGERAPVVGWYSARPCTPGFACGVVFSLIGAAYALVDLSSQSAGVLDTDWRVGTSIEARPWAPGFDRLSVSLGYFHQSSHLGDEYVLSATTIQTKTTAPQVNPALPYRANPSVEAFPIVGSVDVTELKPLRIRVYGGATLLAATDLPSGPQYRIGTEVRWIGPFDHGASPTHRASPAQIEGGAPRRGSFAWRRGDLDFLFAYDVLLQHQYVHLGPEPGPPVFQQVDGHWVTQHGMLTALYSLDPERSSTNAIGVALELLWGRVQHGQFPEYATVKTVGASLSYYW